MCFSRHRWDDRTSSFHSLDPEVDVPWDEGPRTCICCALDDEEKRWAIPRVVGQTLHLRGEIYHQHDHVYLMSRPGNLLDIAQITDVSSASMVKCKLYQRCSSDGKNTVRPFATQYPTSTQWFISASFISSIKPWIYRLPSLRRSALWYIVPHCPKILRTNSAKTPICFMSEAH